MNTIINSATGVAIFLGRHFEVVDGVVVFDDGSTFDGLSNGFQVIDANQPFPLVDGAWSWNGGSWAVYDQSLIDNYYAQQTINFNASQKQKRSDAYRNEADPLYFMAQRGEGTVTEWQAKIDEIRARYPYQE